MDNQSNNKNFVSVEEQIFQQIQNNAKFEIKPCDTMIDLEKDFKKLELSSSQKIHIDALLSIFLQ